MIDDNYQNVLLINVSAIRVGGLMIHNYKSDIMSPNSICIILKHRAHVGFVAFQKGRYNLD